MNSDIVLNGNEVSIKADNLFVKRTDLISTSVNLKNSRGTWHISGPRDEPNSPLSIYWYDGVYHGPWVKIDTKGNINAASLSADRLACHGIAVDSELVVHGTNVGIALDVLHATDSGLNGMITGLEKRVKKLEKLVDQLLTVTFVPVDPADVPQLPDQHLPHGQGAFVPHPGP